MIVIPKGDSVDTFWKTPGHPEWFPISQAKGPHKPLIRCNCGELVGIGLHQVHADGTVTASFYHSKGGNLAIGESPEGCGWHVYLKLDGWDGGDMPAGQP